MFGTHTGRTRPTGRIRAVSAFTHHWHPGAGCIDSCVSERKKLLRRFWAILLLALLTLSFARPAAAERSGNSNPGIVPPNVRAFGLTYGEWSAEWWKYAVGVPAPVNPLLDTTGVNCGAQQSGPVFFLVGAFDTSSSVTRTQCVVPAGKAIFFPIVNTFCQEPDFWFEGCQDPMDHATGMTAEIDGRKVHGLGSGLTTRYRVTAHGFTFTVPDDNIFGVPGGGTFPNRGADGVYLLLAPLHPGYHTIHFHGTIPGLTLDVTYRLRVA
jgi:hypothetical protein